MTFGPLKTTQSLQLDTDQLLEISDRAADDMTVMDDALTQRPRGLITKLAGVALTAALLTVGTTEAQAIRRISPAKLWCDRPDVKKTRVGAPKPTVKIGCVMRSVRPIKRSVLRKDFPTFRSQVASDPRIVVSGGRTLTAGTRTNDYTTRSSDSNSSESSSSSSRSPVSPLLECVARDGATAIAHFGYNNPNTSRVEIAAGSNNRFVPGTGLGQPTLFQPGRVVDVFKVTFSGTLVWTLDGHAATASASSKACATPAAPGFFADQVAVVAMDATGGGAEYQGLRTMGVPAVISPTITDAIRYHIVVLAGAPADGAVSAEDVTRLTAFVAGGGVLVGEAVTDPRLFDLFGLSGATSAAVRSQVDWIADGERTIADLDRASERQVNIDDRFGSAFTTIGYTPRSGAKVLATFDDGTAAVTRKRFGANDANDDDDHEGADDAVDRAATSRSSSDDSGHDDGECDKEQNDHGRGAAYMVGARLTDLVTRHHEGARWSSKARYENAFDTSADGWLLWLRGVYRTHITNGVTLSTAPAGAQFAVMPTLSLNFSVGVGPTVDYVRAAHNHKVNPTVFVWTKIKTDYLDVAFFSDSGPFEQVMQTIKGMGAEIAAHTVAHSPVFDKLPMGSGTETAADYSPTVVSPTITTGATVMGEVRVSRQLIQSRLNPKATSFRAGYLLTTPRLAVAEEAAGIRDDSSSTQGWVGGAFPFSIPRFDGTGYADVTTYPVVIEDERGVRVDQRLNEARDLMIANGDNGAPSTIMFHPNGWDWKVNAWDQLLTSIPGNAWTGTVEQFGDFWQARSRSALVTSASGSCANGRHIELKSLNAAWPVKGQVLDIPDGALKKLVLANGEVRTVNGNGKVVLPNLAGGATVSGELCP